MQKIFLVALACLAFVTTALAKDQHIENQMIPGAKTASIAGVNALWHNPSGLAFMGGSETLATYLHEWSEVGNRHHLKTDLALNFGNAITFAGGVGTKAAFDVKARKQLGTELMGIFGGALKLSKHTAFGLTLRKSYNFLNRAATGTMVGFGLQSRPHPNIAIGAHYQEINEGFFEAPLLTCGISLRAYQDIITVGLDSRFVPLGRGWEEGFRIDPVVNLNAYYQGFGANIGVEFPDIKSGWNKPLFTVALEFDFGNLGLDMLSHINPSGKNYSVGSAVRLASDERPSLVTRRGLWVDLNLDHDGTIEQPSTTFADRIFTDDKNPLATLALLKRIESDQSVEGIILKFKGFYFGDARTEDYRQAIQSLRNANKKVVVYLDAPSERDYYIASAANKILMYQHATLTFDRFRATLVYYNDGLKKLGFDADAVVAGSYKTAPRQWTNARPQKEELEVVNNILTSFYDRLIKDVSEERNIDKGKLKTILDAGEITADTAKKEGLIDDVVYADEIEKSITASGSLPIFHNYEHRRFKRRSWHEPKKIAVIPITDTIVKGRVVPGLLTPLFPMTGAGDVTDEIEKAVNDPDVVGIILRINSPGGVAAAGHSIHRAVVKARESKPVVASMSDVAASAAFLIASAADHIIASPNTITGSIGVFSLLFTAQDFAKRWGINAKELSTIKNPGPTYYRSFSAQERKQAQSVVNWTYDQFVTSVSDSLGLKKEDVLKVAEGRVWLGHEAMDKKLVNELGGFTDAIETIKMLAEVEPEKELSVEVRLPGSYGQFRIGMDFLSKDSRDDLDAIKGFAAPLAKIVALQRLGSTPQARLPFDISWSVNDRYSVYGKD